MEIWEFNFMEYLLRKVQRKANLTKQLSSLPEGFLLKKKRKNRIEYYMRHEGEPACKLQYLSKNNDKKLIDTLERKAEQESAINKEFAFIEKVIKKNLPIAMQIRDKQIFVENKIFPPVESQKDEYKQQLTVRTERGEMVRSKSERFIADAMYKHSLDYRYEQKIELDGIYLHPDFTIINPLNGGTYYLEHLGIDETEYIVSWMNKKHVYNENGIVENKNLIVTTEEDVNRFDEIIERWFTFKRYDGIFEYEKKKST